MDWIKVVSRRLISKPGVTFFYSKLNIHNLKHIEGKRERLPSEYLHIKSVQTDRECIYFPQWQSKRFVL